MTIISRPYRFNGSNIIEILLSGLHLLTSSISVAVIFEINIPPNYLRYLVLADLILPVMAITTFLFKGKPKEFTASDPTRFSEVFSKNKNYERLKILEEKDQKIDKKIQCLKKFLHQHPEVSFSLQIDNIYSITFC
jgi:hypothetical protein